MPKDSNVPELTKPPGELLGGIGSGEMHSAIHQAEHVLERMVVFLEVNKGSSRETPGARLDSNRRQAVCVLVGIRMEQGSVDSAENSSAGTNSESKREDGDRSEDRRFADLASGETAISEE